MYQCSCSREAGLDESSVDEPSHSVEYDVRRLSTIKMSSKLRSFDCILESDNKARILALLVNNTLEMCHVDTEDKKAVPENVTKIANLGHRTDVRTLSWSSDNTAMLSAGGDAVKVWNRSVLVTVIMKRFKCPMLSHV